MKFELKVALKYLKSHQKSRFISVVTFISMAGVAVGVMTLIIVLSVMSGFDQNLRQKIVGINPHIYVDKANGIENPEGVIDKIENVKHVKGASPFLQGQALIRTENQALGVLIKGINIETEPEVTSIDKYILKGSLPKNEEILIGSQLAKHLNLYLYDKVKVISPVERKHFEFKIGGIFESGMYDYDATLTYISLNKAKEFFDTGGLIGTIGVRVDDLFLAEEVKKSLIEELGFGYWIKTWMEINKNLFSSLKLEKTVMFIILVLIVLVACFNIISTLIMTVMEKTKDIGILKSLGATRSSIASVFTYCGLIIGIIGTIIGASIGILACYLLKTYKFIKLPADIYYLETLPVNIQWTDSLIIAFSAILISFLATLYPAYQAAKLNPVEALRYE